MTEELTKGGLGIVGQSKKVGVAAQREAAKLQQRAPDDPTTLPNRLGLVFDDSGSMAGNNAIDHAKEGCEEFFKVCNPADTSVGVYNFTGGRKKLTNDLVSLVKEVRTYGTGGGTPLYGTLQDLIEQQPINRAIVFSDGEPTDKEDATEVDSWHPNPNRQLHGKSVIDLYVEKKIPIDTVFIGEKGNKGEAVLRNIAERTGGYFIHFEKGATSFRTAFKYLAPKFRAMLTDGNFRKKLSQGKVS